MRTIHWIMILVSFITLMAACGKKDRDNIVNPPPSETRLFEKVVVYEQTGSINRYTFERADHRLYEKLYELSLSQADIRTGGCEGFDVYFSDADGRIIALRPEDPLPETVYLTIVCRDVNCNNGQDDPAPSWRGAGVNFDAVELWMEDGTVYYSTKVVNVEWGLCLEPVSENRDRGPENILGAPDGVITGLGGGHSSVTVRLGPDAG